MSSCRWTSRSSSRGRVLPGRPWYRSRAVRATACPACWRPWTRRPRSSRAPRPRPRGWRGRRVWRWTARSTWPAWAPWSRARCARVRSPPAMRWTCCRPGRAPRCATCRCTAATSRAPARGSAPPSTSRAWGLRRCPAAPPCARRGRSPRTTASTACCAGSDATGTTRRHWSRGSACTCAWAPHRPWAACCSSTGPPSWPAASRRWCRCAWRSRWCSPPRTALW